MRRQHAHVATHAVQSMRTSLLFGAYSSISAGVNDRVVAKAYFRIRGSTATATKGGIRSGVPLNYKLSGLDGTSRVTYLLSDVTAGRCGCL
jgi:hypothetical protein